jgi:hypothetical protein
MTLDINYSYITHITLPGQQTQAKMYASNYKGSFVPPTNLKPVYLAKVYLNHVT